MTRTNKKGWCKAVIYNDAFNTVGIIRVPGCPHCTPDHKCRPGVATSIDDVFTKDEQRAMMLETIRELGLG